MKNHGTVAVLVLLTLGINIKNYADAKTSQTGPPQASTGHAVSTDNEGSYRPGAGTIILAQLTRPLEVRNAKVGDEVRCDVIQDLIYKGRVIIPRNAKVVGHVTESIASSKEQPQSRLGLVFDKIVLKDKKELPFQYPAVILALAPQITRGTVSTTQMSDMPVQMEKGRTTGGAAIDRLGDNAILAGANMPAAKGGAVSAADRGVIGMKGLVLEASPETSVIVSSKGDVKLRFETQLVLQVTDPAKK